MGDIICLEAMLSGGLPCMEASDLSCNPAHAPGNGVCNWGLVLTYRAWINLGLVQGRTALRGSHLFRIQRRVKTFPEPKL